MAGMFPEKYMTAVVSGQALGGVFASGARIVSLSVGAQDAISAFIYFSIAVVVMIFTLLAYLYMSKTVSIVTCSVFMKMQHNIKMVVITGYTYSSLYVVHIKIFESLT